MRRPSAAITCLALLPVFAGLAACTNAEPTAPATAATVSKQAGATEAGTALGPGRIAYFLLEGVFQGAGAQGYNFLSDLLTGDGSGVTDTATTEKLDGISSQLTQVTARLGQLENDIIGVKAQVAGVTLSSTLTMMDEWNNKHLTIYNDKFLPLVNKAKTVTAAKQDIDIYSASCGTILPKPTSTDTATSTPAATPTPTATMTTSCATPPPVPASLTDAVTKAVGDLDIAKGEFKIAFDNADPLTTLRNQHNLLYPSPAGGDSVLKQAGASLESKGYVTALDSERLKSLYATMSDEEALSALLILEKDKMFGADAETLKRHQDDYASYNAVELANLPQAIPKARIKVGDRMYRVDTLYDPGARQNLSQEPRAWLPISPEGHQLGSWDAKWLLGTPDNVGWDLPSDAELTALYEGTKNVKRANSSYTHLGSVLLNGQPPPAYPSYYDWNQKWFWTKDTSQSQPMTCIVNQSREVQRIYTLHHIGYMANDDAIGLQSQPGAIPPKNDGSPGTEVECDNIMNRLYDNSTYAGSVLMTQPVDAEKDNFMAERVTAVPASTPASSGTSTGTSTGGSGAGS